MNVAVAESFLFFSYRLKFHDNQLRPHLHHTGEIWKRSFISTVRHSSHSNPFFKPKEFENAG